MKTRNLRPKSPEKLNKVEGAYQKPLHLIHKDAFTDKMIHGWGMPLTAEFRFYPLRLWRFDYAFTPFKVAVEVEGGIFSGGRHSRGAGMSKDMEKYNTAASMNWLVLKATPAMLSDDEFLCVLFDTLVLRGAIECL